MSERQKVDGPIPTPVLIPETSKQRYLGGMGALNLPSPKGTGDWHMLQHFFMPELKPSPSFISGEGCMTNTNHLLGDRGIYDCTAILDAIQVPYETSPVYAASHARATADLVLSAILSNGSPRYVVLDDWMPCDSDKQEVFDLLEVAMKQLNHKQKEQVLLWKHKNPFDT
jgi:hypothetical protein